MITYEKLLKGLAIGHTGEVLSVYLVDANPDGDATRARDLIFLAGVGLAAVSVATPSDLDAGRDLRVRLAFASVKAGAGDVAARTIGLRPSPSSLASVERRSE
jgi:hypothetical protein